MIDTAEVYRNEAAVGAGLKSSGVDRKDIFISQYSTFRFRCLRSAHIQFETCGPSDGPTVLPDETRRPK